MSPVIGSSPQVGWMTGRMAETGARSWWQAVKWLTTRQLADKTGWRPWSSLASTDCGWWQPDTQPTIREWHSASHITVLGSANDTKLERHDKEDMNQLINRNRFM